MMDHEWFRQRYIEHYPGIKSYFLGKGFPPEDAEELTQEVFFRVFKFSEDFRDDGAFASWLNVIAANTWKNCIRDMRAQKRQAIEIPLDSPNVVEDQYLGNTQMKHPIDHTIQKELSRELKEAIKQLPETVYACMVLRIYHELSYNQIAELLGIPYEKVKSRLYQAQTKLKEMLEGKIRVDLLEKRSVRPN